MGLTSLILEFIAGPDEGRRVCMAEFRSFLIGRGKEVDVPLPAVDTSVSRRQAYIELSPQGCALKMVAGSNLVVKHNGVLVENHCLLADGDILDFGTTSAKTTATVSLVFNDFACFICGEPVVPVNRSGTDDLADVSVYAHENCAMPSSSAAASPFGPYEISGDLIGTGGAGSVYRVYHRPSRRLWALKHRTNHEQARRFDREMYELQSLRHPNIIRFVHGNVDAEGVPYFVMELAREGSLAGLVGKLTDVEKIDLLCEVLEALKYLHKAGKVHRDLKPDNILVQSDGSRSGRQAKLTDLGLLKGGDGIVLTAKGRSFCGTVPFIAPEQIDGLHEVDERADVYSAGVTLYWLLSQHTPIEFSEMQTEAMIREEILSGERTSLRQWRPDLAARLIKGIDRACHKDARRRFQTAEQFQDALLEQIRAGRS